MGDPEAEPSDCYKRQLCAKSGHIEGLAMTKWGRKETGRIWRVSQKCSAVAVRVSPDRTGHFRRSPARSQTFTKEYDCSIEVETA